MKVSTHASAPALRGYSKDEQFLVFRKTHKRLMRDDTAYRNKYMSYLASIVCVSVFPLGSSLASGAHGIWLAGFVILASISAIFYLAFRQQAFMNRAVEKALQHGSAEHDADGQSATAFAQKPPS